MLLTKVTDGSAIWHILAHLGRICDSWNFLGIKLQKWSKFIACLKMLSGFFYIYIEGLPTHRYNGPCFCTILWDFKFCGAGTSVSIGQFAWLTPPFKPIGSRIASPRLRHSQQNANCKAKNLRAANAWHLPLSNLCHRVDFGDFFWQKMALRHYGRCSYSVNVAGSGGNLFWMQVRQHR